MGGVVGLGMFGGDGGWGGGLAGAFESDIFGLQL